MRNWLCTPGEVRANPLSRRASPRGPRTAPPQVRRTPTCQPPQVGCVSHHPPAPAPSRSPGGLLPRRATPRPPPSSPGAHLLLSRCSSDPLRSPAPGAESGPPGSAPGSAEALRGGEGERPLSGHLLGRGALWSPAWARRRASPGEGGPRYLAEVGLLLHGEDRVPALSCREPSAAPSEIEAGGWVCQALHRAVRAGRPAG